MREVLTGSRDLEKYLGLEEKPLRILDDEGLVQLESDSRELLEGLVGYLERTLRLDKKELPLVTRSVSHQENEGNLYLPQVIDAVFHKERILAGKEHLFSISPGIVVSTAGEPVFQIADGGYIVQYKQAKASFDLETLSNFFQDVREIKIRGRKPVVVINGVCYEMDEGKNDYTGFSILPPVFTERYPDDSSDGLIKELPKGTLMLIAEEIPTVSV